MENFDIKNNKIYKAQWNASLECYTIPSFVTEIIDGSISDYAFIDFTSKIFSIDFEENCLIEIIGSYTFYNCKQLQSINFTNAIKLKEIHGYSFRYCTSLKSVIFPKSLEKFGYYGAFSYCYSLTNVTFPKDSNLISIAAGTFGMCPLKTFTFPKKYEPEHSLGEVFSETDIEEFKVEDNYYEYIGIFAGSVYNKDFTILYVHNKGTEFKLHPNTIKFEYLPFSGSKCSHIIVPETIKDFGTLTFFCFYGTKITMLSTPQTIGDRFFNNCPNLREIVLCEGLKEITLSTYGPTIQTNGKLQSIYIPYSLKSFDYNSIDEKDWKTCFYGNVQFIKNQIKDQTKYRVNNCYIGIKITPHCGRNIFVSNVNINFIFIYYISL